MPNNWTYEVLRTQAKNDKVVTTVRFTRTTGEERTHCFTFDSIAQRDAEGAERANKKCFRLESGYSTLNRFVIEIDATNPLRGLLAEIKADPDMTVGEATTWFDTQYPSSPVEASYFLTKLRENISEIIGHVPTWAEFRTYVINNIFENVDVYS